ncbi:MAG: hypothetical protein ACJ0A6_02405 [Dehalococcoidia bacterium]
MSFNEKTLGEIATDVLFENDKVKVWNLILKPGEASDWHMHKRDYITICIEGGGLDAEFHDGSTGKGSNIGDWAYHGDHQIHRVINNTKNTYKNILIELKK